MAARNPPLWLQAGSHPATNDRLLLEALMAPPPAVVSGAGYGIVAPGDMAVTQNGTPNMSVNVAAGKAFVDGTENANQGAYLCVNDATVNLAISASSPTNPRKDLVVAKVQDAEWSGATNSWSLAVVTGTPAASPAEPAVPANAIVLALVDVAANATTITNANITDRRRRASTLGGLIVCTSTTRPTGSEGLHIWESDTQKVLIYTAGAWVDLVPAGPWSSYTPALTASGTNPTLGAGSSAVGKYTRIGRTIMGHAWIKFGSSGVAAGSGNYRVSLPVLPSNIGVVGVAGYGYAQDSSASALYVITAYRVGAVQYVEMPVETATVVTNASPFVWDVTDEIAISFTYEAAS